jgi:hypothetical protein
MSTAIAKCQPGFERPEPTTESLAEVLDEVREMRARLFRLNYPVTGRLSQFHPDSRYGGLASARGIDRACQGAYQALDTLATLLDEAVEFDPAVTIVEDEF